MVKSISPKKQKKYLNSPVLMTVAKFDAGMQSFIFFDARPSSDAAAADLSSTDPGVAETKGDVPELNVGNSIKVSWRVCIDCMLYSS